MRKATFALCLATVAAISVLSISSAATSPTATIITPDSLKWTPVKGMAGAQEAVLWGDPNKAGSWYTERYKLVDGFRLAPHWHPSDEHVTVLSGTLMFGVGDKMDAAKMTAVPAGSFINIPAKVRHYVVAKGETVIQDTSKAPFTVHLVK